MTLLSPINLLRSLSVIVGLMLFVVACIGFKTLNFSFDSVESQAQLGCLCFLGVCFGLLLAFGETTWELFFFFFGFMRYRLGRACIFALSGTMTAILGKTRGQQCNCHDNLILIIEGGALVAMAILQILAILLFGNSNLPRNNKEAICFPIFTRPREAMGTPFPKEAILPCRAIVQPISELSSHEATLDVRPTSPTPRRDNKLPSWMQTS
ncbi:hypothetical protein CCR75_002277 [Bremia lactucae]|uniref:Uncharacterized protein n=1 Tax=Bremia lactucae TaxID=4779 RepID=A0A976IF98_BRELC|nr:hypothetical protein CCR75_002277 [Bremia lactucae]